LPKGGNEVERIDSDEAPRDDSARGIEAQSTDQTDHRAELKFNRRIGFDSVTMRSSLAHIDTHMSILNIRSGAAYNLRGCIFNSLASQFRKHNAMRNVLLADLSLPRELLAGD